MLDPYRAYLIALILNVIAGLVVWLIAENTVVALAVFTCFCVIAALALALFSYRAIGLRRAAKVRTALPELRKCLDLAESSMDYLGCVPMVHIPESELLDKLVYKAQRGCSFRFLMLDPASRFALQRRKDGGAYTPSQILHLLERLLEVRDQLGEKRQNLRVAIYDEYPVWCIGVVDDRFSFLSFYGSGKPGVEHPALLLQKGPCSFHEACRLHFEELWKRAREIQTASDLGRQVVPAVAEAEQGGTPNAASPRR
jgi:hypothetical protein